MSKTQTVSRLSLSLLAGWMAVAAALVALAALLLAFRGRFDWARDLSQIPSLPLAAGLVAAGVAFAVTLPLVCATERLDSHAQRHLLAFVLAVGLGLRLMMFPTEPALEDDQQRYLFEGAMVAHGLSPYRHAPEDAKRADRTSPLGRLADASQPVLDRINHPALTTIYPPVAEAAFALSYLLEPFSLRAWRALLLAAELGTVLLLVQLLRHADLSPVRVALYWWNPVAIKEIANSGHFEGVLMLFVVAAVALAARGRHVAASGVLGLAAGIKIWPVILAPVLLRPLVRRPRALLAAAAIIAGLVLAWAAIVLLAGADQRSGFLAYAERWQANSAVLPALRGAIASAGAALGVSLDTSSAGRMARLFLACAAGLYALAAARHPLAGPNDLLHRVATVTLVLVLVSPAQFPWYALWTLPFLPFAPRWGVVAMAVTLPIYYASFHFSAIGAYEIFRDRVVWLVWLPVWLLLAVEALYRRRGHGRAKRRTTEA